MSADYQFQIPKKFSYQLPVACISVIIAIGVSYFLSDHRWLSIGLSSLVLLIGSIYVGMCLFIRKFTNLDRRLEARDQLLNQIPWQGHETVLDVGCGNGILILSAAKRLTVGKAIGIDIWTENSGDNSKTKFEINAVIEGVTDKVAIQNEDARKLPYNDSSFEVILCGLTMHHILHDKCTDKAISEMVRVLKPGGYIAVFDVPIAIMSTSKLLNKEGVEIKKVGNDIAIGIKPANNSMNTDL